ncbi:MAG: hypothetical protein ACYDCC_08760 [Actinomycetota bacterium]
MLFASLIMVIPQHREQALSQLIVAGAVSLIIILPSLVAAARSPTRTLRLSQLLARLLLSVLSYGGVIFSGTLLGAHSFNHGLATLAIALVALLVISLRNSWDLLVSVGDAE